MKYCHHACSGYFLNVATGQLTVVCVAYIIFLLGSSGLEIEMCGLDGGKDMENK